jgi:hypothetical protein
LPAISSSKLRPLLEGLAEDEGPGPSDKGVEMFENHSRSGSGILLGVGEWEKGIVTMEGLCGIMKFVRDCGWKFSAVAASSADRLLSGNRKF